jgi:DNA-binding SARP family transcriptional activator/WD40 repeat protein
MRIAVLGPLEVVTDDLAPVSVPGAKERLLLAVLAARAPHVVSTDFLAETLWDGLPPISARKSLQTHVMRLRSTLEPDRPKDSTGRYVVRRGAGYALTIDRGSIDALQIGDLAARGHARLASGQPAEAESQLRAAVDLWHGEPYADWPDAPFAKTERRRLTEVRAGAVAGLLEAQLQLGRHADVLPDLERLVAEDPLRENWWRLLMFALYRAGRQADALAAGRRVRALLSEELGASPGPALRDMEAAILAQDPALELASGRAPSPVTDHWPTAATGSCPYKGLASYQVADAPLFHGRQRLVENLVARLVDAPVIVVSGPSGAGKSSAVRAGLIPALADGALPGSQAWRPVIVTPGAAPVDGLSGLTGEAPPADPVLLIVDQFEQLWAPGIDPGERSAFLDAVLGLIDDGVVVRCVVVVRGDHIGRLAEHPVFTDRLGAAFALVPPLTDPELREIVREPARSVGLRVDAELLDAVVTDVLGQAGALPLLSTALVGTWERRRADLLTLAGYLETGGVSGALTRSAEAAYGALDQVGQDLARRLFVRLADTDDGGALVRRRVPLVELDLESEPRAARRQVVEVLVGRRLLAVDGSSLEVAHEALLTAWPRVTRWLEDDAAGRAVRRHLAPAAREWEAGDRRDDELYRGARLTAALDWAGGSGAEVTPLEQEFLDASEEAADEELTAAQQRADREAAGRHREAAARHRTRRLAAGLAAVLVVALVATFLAVRAQRDARRASLIADANRLAALSTTAGRLDLSLLLAVQAVRLADTPETQDGLLAALTAHGPAERAVPFGGAVRDAHLSGGRGTVFFGNGYDLVTWVPRPSTLPEPVLTLPDWAGGWNVSAPSPTDDVLMAAGTDRQGRPWVRLLAADGTSDVLASGSSIGGTPLAGRFSADGRQVHLLVAEPNDATPAGASDWHIADVDALDGTARATSIGGTFPAAVDALTADFADDGGSAVLWDSAGAAPATLIDLTDGQQSPVQAHRPGEILDFRALPTGAAQLWDDGAVTLLDRGGAPVQQLDAHQEPVLDVVVAPDRTWAVTAGEGPAPILWDLDPASGRWSQREVLTGHDRAVVAVEVDATGERLYTVSRDHTVITWDMSPDGGLGGRYPALPDRWISNRPQVVDPGQLVVAPTRSGHGVRADAYSAPGPDTLSVAATFLDPVTGEVVAQEVVGDTAEGVTFGSSVAVSPDGSTVAVTWGLGVTVLDTHTREQIARYVSLSEGGPAGGGLLPGSHVWSAVFTPDGARLLLGVEEATGRGHLAAVDTETWKMDSEPASSLIAAQAMEVSPDGSVIAVSSSTEPLIAILDAQSLEMVHSMAVVDGLLTDLSFSHDGRMLAAGGAFGLLHVWDTATWQPVRDPPTVHDAALLQVEWRPDDRTVVTSGGDGTVSLFDVDRGLVRGRPLRASGEPEDGYAFLLPESTDELVALSGDRTGWRYPLDPSVWLDEACTIVGRDLTQAEWDTYLPGRDREPTCTDLP